MRRPVAAAAVLALAAAVAAAGDAPAPGPAVPSRVEVADARSPRPRRAVHDVVDATLEAAGGALTASVRLARPFADGVFACLHVKVDCDDDRATGIDGADLWARGAYGSRFERASAPGRPGVPAPGTLRRASWSEPHVEDTRAGKGRTTWLHTRTEELDPPVVEGDRLTLRVPLALLAAHGLRYNRVVRVRLELEDSCSEHPVHLDHVCADEGTPVLVDGDDVEWSGQATVADAVGELHPDVAEVDVASLSVDHDAGHVHALVRLALPGFGEPVSDLDVEDRDAVTVAFEPLAVGGGYGGYLERTVRTRLRSGDGVAGRARVEVSVPRAPGQGAYRVAAWADAVRVDRVPDAGDVAVGVPPEAFGRR